MLAKHAISGNQYNFNTNRIAANTFCCWTSRRIPLYWSHCKVFPRSIAVVVPAGNEVQFDSDWPPGVGEGGGSSVVTATLRLIAGVTAGSLHANVQRFLMILGFGHGSRCMHSSKSFANALADRVFHKGVKTKEWNYLPHRNNILRIIYNNYFLFGNCINDRMGRKNYNREQYSVRQKIKHTFPGTKFGYTNWADEANWPRWSNSELLQWPIFLVTSVGKSNFLSVFHFLTNAAPQFLYNLIPLHISRQPYNFACCVAFFGSDTSIVWSNQPRPQGLLLVQNGGRRNPWPRLLKYSTNRGVFCHVTSDEMAFSEVVSSVWRPYLFSAIRTVIQTKRRHFIVFAWRNSNELLEPLWQPWPGVSPTAILNEEKTLGKRLWSNLPHENPRSECYVC